MGKIEILEDYNKPFIFQGKDYLLNYDPDAYAVEAVEKYWSDKILPLSVEIQGTSHDWENDITKEEAEELAKEKLSEKFKVMEDFLDYYKRDGHGYYENGSWQYTQEGEDEISYHD